MNSSCCLGAPLQGPIAIGAAKKAIDMGLQVCHVCMKALSHVH